jgi:hypothetical protein
VAFPTITEADGALSATGLAKEVTFGTPVAATTFLPMSGNSMEVDPGWFSPTLMQALRDKQVYNLQGEEHFIGALDGPLFPSNAMELLVASIGADNIAGAGVTGTAGTGSTTLSGTVLAGVTSITLASATGFSTGQVVQIDVNGTGPTTTAECRMITLSGTTATFTPALVYGHTSGCTITGVVAPYTHTIQQQNTLPSLTIEKNIGDRQSLQFAGCRVNKFDLKAPVGNEPVALTADMMGQSVTILDSPTGVSVTNELPWVFTEASVTFYTTARTEAANLTLSIDNAIKETYTYSGQHGPSFLTPINLHVSGTLDMVWSSLDNATYGDFNRMYNQTLGALNFTLTHPSSAGSIAISIPQIALSKYANDLKAEDVIMSGLTWEASRPLTGSSQYTIQATVTNSIFLPY